MTRLISKGWLSTSMLLAIALQLSGAKMASANPSSLMHSSYVRTAQLPITEAQALPPSSLGIYDLRDPEFQKILLFSLLGVGTVFTLAGIGSRISLRKSNSILTTKDRTVSLEAEAIHLLNEGDAFDWNEWREKHSSFVINLPHIDLSGRLLRHFNLAHINFAGANFARADLAFADLSHADLSGANLRSAMLGGVNGLFADLREANLNYASIENATFCQAALQGAKLSHANLRRTNFSMANLTQVDFKHSNLEAVDLQGACVFLADFANACIDCVQWTVPATEIDFTKLAALAGADFKQSKPPESEAKKGGYLSNEELERIKNAF